MTHVVECPCMFGAAREGNYKENIEIQEKWQKVEEEVVRRKKKSSTHN